MAEQKKTSPLLKRILAIFSSKRSRNTAWLLLILFAIVSMFLIDKENNVRSTTFLSFLDENAFSDFMAYFNIERYNVTSSSWVLFSAMITVAIMILIGNIVAPKHIDKKVQKNRHLFASEQKARRFYTFTFYGVLFLIAAVIVLIAFLIGAFALYGNNTVEKSPFLSLITMLSIFLAILLAIPVTILVAFFVIKFIFIAFVYFLHSAIEYNKKLNETEQEKEVSKPVKKASSTASVDTSVANAQPAPESIGGNQDLFPTLTEIDNANLEPKTKTDATPISLDAFVKQFQSFAINKHHIYYELSLLRQFLAGLASSRLIILEGLSGTGKSMLPRMFKEFTDSSALFTPVQATWRDKTDVLGFYSEFTGTFKATAFLEKLYAASYDDKINLFILDEMNLSRIEYYFADFLSVMEYPEEDWKVKAYLPFDNRPLPAKLENGFVTIPNNSWFIGTANTDDSTFTITDKVCDRAIILNFEDRFSKIESNNKYEPISIKAEQLQKMFDEALNDTDKQLNDSDLKKFDTLCDYVKDKFDILFGNRIMVQIEKFVPVFVALGGTKEEALDFMFAKKILRKLSGKYEAYLKDELAALKLYINNLYGKGVFKETERFIDKTVKKLG